MNTYRCMKCGNNLLKETDEGLICPACFMDSGFVLVTEENKNKIPFPTHLNTFDPNYDENVCYHSSGNCPCGNFTTHPTNEVCDVVDKYIGMVFDKPDNCQCASVKCPCGEYIAHEVSEPCNGIV